MFITEIIPYGKMKSRVLTDEGLVFSLYRSEIGRFGLAENKELPEAFWEEILRPLLLKRAKERLLKLLEVRDYSEKELLRKLTDASCPEEIAEEALSWTAEHHFTDDRRYAENYLRWQAAGKSRKRLMFDLMKKGIDGELAKELLEDAEIDEDAQIDRELKKKQYDPDDPDPKKKKRIAAFLAGKGYSWNAISEAFHRAERN